MLTKQRDHIFQSLRRVRNVIRLYVAALTTLDLLPARRALDSAIAEIDRLRVDRQILELAVRGATTEVGLLRNDLWVHALHPAAVAIRTKLRHIPELAAFQVPARDASAGALILAAHTMAGAIGRHRRVFTQAGLPVHVEGYLVSHANALAAEVTALAHHRACRARNSALIDAELRRGREAVRVLEVAAASQFGAESRVLATWKNARRIAPTAVAPALVLLRAA